MTLLILLDYWTHIFLFFTDNFIYNSAVLAVYQHAAQFLSLVQQCMPLNLFLEQVIWLKLRLKVYLNIKAVCWTLFLVFHYSSKNDGYQVSVRFISLIFSNNENCKYWSENSGPCSHLFTFLCQIIYINSPCVPWLNNQTHFNNINI